MVYCTNGSLRATITDVFHLTLIEDLQSALMLIPSHYTRHGTVSEMTKAELIKSVGVTLLVDWTNTDDPLDR